MSEHPTMRAVARFLPGIVAASLALIYVVGSVNAAGAFSYAGLSVSAVRLLSLEQILVRGVSVITQPGLMLTGLVLIAAVTLVDWFLSKILNATAADSARRRKFRRVASPLATILLISGVAGLVLTPWRVSVLLVGFFALAGFFLLLAGPQIAEIHNQDDVRRAKTRVFSIAFVALAMVYVAANFLIPLRQPNAVVTLAGPGTTTRGIFVTHANGDWYVAVDNGSSGKAIEAFPDEEVGQVRLVYPGDPPEPSLFAILFD